MHFSLEKLLNYTGNRYQLARACMEYAKRVRHVSPDEYYEMGEKEALISIKHVLEEEIKHTSDAFEIEIYEDEAEVIISQREMEMQRKLEKEEANSLKNADEDNEFDEMDDAGGTPSATSSKKKKSKVTISPGSSTDDDDVDNDDEDEEETTNTDTEKSEMPADSSGKE